MCYKDYGYGQFNEHETAMMDFRTPEEQQEWLRYLYKDDPVKYFEWKKWNMDANFLSHLFGTHENPIDLHEEEW